MTDTIKLTDTQSVILSLAAQNEEGVTVDTINEKVNVQKPKRAADALAKRGFLVAGKFNIEGVIAAPGYQITAEGKAALGIDDETPAEDELPRYDPDHARKGTVPIPAKDDGEREGDASAEDEEDAADAHEAAQEPDAATWPEVKEKVGLEPKTRAPRTGTKQEALIEMLKRPEGASVPEVTAKFGWASHTVRGAISGALKKKLGLTVTTEKIEGRGTVYRIPA